MRGNGRRDRSTAQRLKPATDIDLGVGLAAIVTGMGFVGGLFCPFEDGELCVAAMDGDPPDRPVGFFAADFTSINSVDHLK